MKVYSASIKINASPEIVWNVLLDTDNYPNWDPNMVRVEGRIALGEKVSFFTKLSPDRAFPTTVKELTPHKTIVFQGGMPFGLFKSVRVHTLEEVDGQTEFSTQEAFSGVLLPLFGKQIPNLNPIFEVFCEGLKSRAEGG